MKRNFINFKVSELLFKRAVVFLAITASRLTEAGLSSESAQVFLSSSSEAAVFQSRQIYENLSVSERGPQKLKIIKSEEGELRCSLTDCKLTVIPKVSSVSGNSLFFKGKLAEKLMRKLNLDSEERLGGLTKSVGNLTCSASMSFPKKYACRFDRMTSTP
jgi:hypothetical protein